MTTQVDHTAYINAMISCCGRRTRARGSAFGSARSTAALSQSSPARAFTGEVARSSAPEADQTCFVRNTLLLWLHLYVL